MSALVGVAAGSGLAWGVITRLLRVPWVPRATEFMAAAGITVALAVAVGLLASARALSIAPAAVLRSS